MRTVYLGTSEFAADVLRALAASEHAPALAVAPPDSRQGRGRRTSPPPVVPAAAELGIGLHRTASVNEPESVRAIRDAAPDAVVVCAFGQLISEPLLGEHEFLNVHPSLLPRWRGAAPIERAVMEGDESTGVAIIRLTAELDAGPVALSEETPIGPDDYHDVLSARLAAIAGTLLVSALDRSGRGELSFTEQDENRVTYAEKIAPDERVLRPARAAAELAWTVRALNPHIGTHLELETGERLGVRRAHAVEDAPEQGMLLERDRALVLGTAKGGLQLEVVQAPGGRPMEVAHFLDGHPAPKRAL